MDVFLIFLVLFAGLMLLTVAWSSISLAPFVPARKKDLKRIFELAEMGEGDVFYDLGCGNGRVAVWGAKRLPIKAYGIEAAWPMWLVCKVRGIFRRNLEFKFGNLFKQDLSGADVVYFFGMPGSAQKRLKLKLEEELKPGAKVISYAFELAGWKAERVDKPEKNEVAIYLYIR